MIQGPEFFSSRNGPIASAAYLGTLADPRVLPLRWFLLIDIHNFPTLSTLTISL